MSSSALGARQRAPVSPREPAGCSALPPRRLVSVPEPGSADASQFSRVDLGDTIRLSLMLVPRGRGAFTAQLREMLAAMDGILRAQPFPMTVVTQTLFLRDAGDEAECRRLLGSHYGPNLPVTNCLFQPPCCGAALSLEAWAIGGPKVRIQRFGPHALAVSYDNMRWVYCAGLAPAPGAKGPYAQTLSTLEHMRTALRQAGSDFERVVRTWFYLGGITEVQDGVQRYMEMNRARTDFYRDVQFGKLASAGGLAQGLYPASTGIGMVGEGLLAGCLSLQTHRKDARLLHLENPQQTPAFAYHSRYSPRSPKFSRAMALQLGDYLTTWISGTASIVNSESRHLGDIERQVEQTLENIEQLLAPENFLAHGQPGAGAQLGDLAKARVYLKRPEDFPKCKAICERRLGPVPTIYAVADVCRPELLVEIEGVAFSRGT